VKTQDLRDLADFLDKHPTLCDRVCDDYLLLNIVAENKAELVEAADLLAPCEVIDEEQFRIVRKKFGFIRLDLFMTREEMGRQAELAAAPVDESDIPY
jgi:hypothetical protein